MASTRTARGDASLGIANRTAFFVGSALALFASACSCGGGGADGCAGDAQCAQGMRCIHGSCVASGCIGDGDCLSGRCLVETGECVECMDDGDCDGSYACDTKRHSCFFVGCDTDQDCRQGVCNRLSGVCVECLADSDCEEGRCDRLEMKCIKDDCKDDRLEPDDFPREARELSAGWVQGLVLCPGDEDYYKFDLNTGDTFSALVKVHGKASIVAKMLLEDTLDQVVSGNEKDGDIVLNLDPVVMAGTYLVVLGDAGAGRVEYDLEFHHSSRKGSCEDDQMEDNDSRNNAMPVSKGKIEGLELCPRDPDFFSIAANKGDSLEVMVETKKGVEVSGALLSPQGLELASEQTSSGKMTLAYGPVQWSGLHVVRLRQSVVEQGVPYSMAVGVTPGVSTCPDDLFEENDSVQNAVSLKPGRIDHLWACPFDPDFFEVMLQAGEALTAKVFAQDVADMSLELVDSGSGTLVGKVGKGDGVVTVETPEAGDSGAYLAVIESTKPVEYDLELVVERLHGRCRDDGMEENDDIEHASELVGGVASDLILCTGDPDFYALSLAAGQGLKTVLTPAVSGADTDLTVYGPDGKVLAMSWTDADIESVELESVQVSGTYYIEVSGGTDSGVAYNLRVDVSDHARCQDDALEENDECVSASAVPGGELYDLVLCPGDADVYAVPLNKGDRVEAGVFPSAAGNSFGVEWLLPDCMTAASVAVADSDTVLEHVAEEHGTYFLRISSNGDTPLDYGVLVETYPAQSDCRDDAMEEDDDIRAGTWVAAGRLNDLVSCPHDDDFFKVNLEQGSDLLVGVDAVVEGESGYLGMALFDPSGDLLDLAELDASGSMAVSTGPVSGAGDFGIWVAADDDGRALYDLSISASKGGRSGRTVVSLSPARGFDEVEPLMLELQAHKAPKGAVAESVVVDKLSVVHERVSDVTITAAFGDGGDMVLWNGQGGVTDMGMDDDPEDDGDIELEHKVLPVAGSAGAGDTLLLLFEDNAAGGRGTLVKLTFTVYWKIR